MKEKNNCLISVIIPTFNSEKTIKRSLDSVVNQTYKNLEILVIDDFSKDQTVKIIKEYENKDDRIKIFILNKNQGAAVSRTKGLLHATGEYIAFLDSDDAWLPEKIQEQKKFMIKNGYNFSFTAYLRIEDNLKQKVIHAEGVIDYKKLLNGNVIGCSTVMLKNGIIEDNTFPLLRKRQDFAYWLKVLKQGNKAYGFNEILTYYFVQKNSLSSNKLNLINYQWQLFRNIEEMPFIKALYFFLKSITTSFTKK